jgi:hypothetical protein
MQKQLKVKISVALGALAIIIIISAGAIIMKRSGRLTLTGEPKANINPVSTNDLPPLDNNVPPRDPNLTNEQNLVKDYIVAHLSELSPTKEVLGGKFYLTKITFTDGQGADISYEDGHIALEAKVTYSLDVQKLTITSFKITKEN